MEEKKQELVRDDYAQSLWWQLDARNRETISGVECHRDWSAESIKVWGAYYDITDLNVLTNKMITDKKGQKPSNNNRLTGGERISQQNTLMRVPARQKFGSP